MQFNAAAIQLYGNFGEKFPSNATGTENRNGIELYHLQNTGKLFASSRPEARHWLSKQMVQKISVASVKTGKGNISKGITLFPENVHRDEPVPFEFSPEIFGFSIQMVSAQYFCR